MAFPWGPALGGFAQGLQEGQESQLHQQQVRQALAMQAMQMEAMKRQQAVQQLAGQANIAQALKEAYGEDGQQPPQPGQASQPAAAPQFPSPPQTDQPIAPGSFADTMTGVGNLPPPPGAPQGAPMGRGGPMPPSPPASGAAAISRTPPGAMAPYMAPAGAPGQAAPMTGLPPPPTPDATAQASAKKHTLSPVALFKAVLGDLEKKHPGNPLNADAALYEVQKWDPILKGERADELNALKAEVAANKAGIEAYKATIEAFKARTRADDTGSKIAEREAKERRLGSMTPFKIEALLSKIGVDRARAQKLSHGGGGEGGSWSSREKELLASMAEYGVNLPTGLRAQKQIRATLQGLLERHPEATTDEIAEGIRVGKIDLAAATAAARSVGASTGRVEFAIQDMQEMSPLVLEASKKLPRGSFVPVNKLMAAFRNNAIQDPNQRELASYINSMLNAYDMLAARGGTDVEKRKEAHALLTQADSPETLERGIIAFMNEAKAAERAGGKARASIAGGKGAGANPAAGKSPEDQAAIEWAKANPNDPRAKKILELNK